MAPPWEVERKMERQFRINYSYLTNREEPIVTVAVQERHEPVGYAEVPEAGDFASAVNTARKEARRMIDNYMFTKARQEWLQSQTETITVDSEEYR